jgi:hypothetical protein
VLTAVRCSSIDPLSYMETNDKVSTDQNAGQNHIMKIVNNRSKIWHCLITWGGGDNNKFICTVKFCFAD